MHQTKSYKIREAIYRKNYVPQSGRVYSKDARWVQYLKIKQCNSPS